MIYMSFHGKLRLRSIIRIIEFMYLCALNRYIEEINDPVFGGDIKHLLVHPLVDQYDNFMYLV